MRRKLTAAIFTVSTLTSGLVHALGLGEVTVRSSLNQPLNAEIELLSVDELTEREIITALASREDFLRANVERTYFLSDLRFKVEMKPGGGAVIRVSSARPVKEPYLNFLLEVNWPTGRLLREYALLIDPPTFSKEAPAQVIPAASTSRVNTGVAAAPTPSSASSASTGSSRAVTGGQYGPTSRTDTLWSIALETRPSADVSPQQMMLALQDANPDAFFDNNINRLKMGKVLRIPSADEALRRAHREAVVQVSAQNRAFAAGSAGAAPIDARPEGREESQVATRPQTSAQDQLRIVADPDAAAGKSSGAVSGKPGASGGGDAELVVTQERLDKAERDKSDLQGRVGELEQQLETLQRLMSLKDEQLAGLQARLGESAGETQAPVMAGKVDEGAATAVAPETPVAAETPAATETLAATETSSAGNAAGAPAEAQAPAIPEGQVGSETVSLDETSESSPAEETMPEATSGAATHVPSAKVVEEKPLIKPHEVKKVVVEDEGLFDEIKNNPAYQVAIGAGGIVLLLILWLLSRNSARKESEYLERHQDESPEDDRLFEGLDFGKKEGEEKKATASQKSDNGPIEEADVYIAYKRYDQAAKVLQAAASKNPGDSQIQLKLLEVAGESADKALFDKTSAALLALGIPAVAAQVNRLKADYESAFEDEGLSLDDLENQLLSGKLPEQKSISEDLDIDDAPGVGARSELSSSLGAIDEEPHDNLDIDFDLGDIEMGDEPQSVAAAADEDEIEDDIAVANTREENETATLNLDDAALADEDDLDATLEQGLDDDFDLARVEGESEVEAPVAELEPEMGDDLSDELRALEAESDDLGLPAQEETEELSLDLSEDDLDFNAGANDALDARLDDLDNEIGQMEGRLGAEVDETLETVTDADLSDDLTEVSSELDLSEDLAEDFLDSVDDRLASEPVAAPEAAELPAEEEALVDADDLMSSAAELGTDETAAMEGESESDLEDDFEFLAGTDEAATKLDLARAYIEMGDREGARDILEEVLEEGNEDQKQDAAKLIEGLS